MERPSPDVFWAAFGGRFYGPVALPIVGARHSDWGTHDGAPESLGLVVSLVVGQGVERLIIRNSLSPEPAERMVQALLFGKLPTRFRFPVVVERGKTRIDFDGHERVFTTYTYREHVLATAGVRNLFVTVGCRRRLLPRLELGALEPGQLAQLMHDADDFRARARRGPQTR